MARASGHTAGMLAQAVQVLRSSATTNGRRIRNRDPYRTAYLEGRLLEPPLPPERLLTLVEENAVHGPCVAAKAYDAIGRGWLLEAEGPSASDGGGPPSAAGQPIDPEHATAHLGRLLEDLTPDLSFSELLFQAAYEREAIGWSAWEVVRDAGGAIGALYPLPAHTLRATTDPDLWCQGTGPQRRYFVRFGVERVIDPATGRDDGALSAEERASEILVFKGYSARSRDYGVPLWINAVPAIAELTAIREYNVSWFASGGMSDRVLHVTAADEATATAISDAIKAQFEAARGLGHTTVFTAGTQDVGIAAVQLTQIGTTGRREGQFGQRRGDLIKEVLMAHSVPPYRIGWAELGSLGGNAAREMLRSYKQDAVQPLQTLLEDRLNQTLFGPKGLNLQGMRWRFSPLSWDETELNLEVAIRGVEAGVLSPNEGRQLLGRSHIDDPTLDRHYRQGTVLGAAGSVPPMGPGPATTTTTTAAAADTTTLLMEFKSALEAAIAGEDAAPLAPPVPASDQLYDRHYGEGSP